MVIGVGVDVQQPAAERRADRRDRRAVPALGDVGIGEQRLTGNARGHRERP